MRDFTLEIYQELLNEFIGANYFLCPYKYLVEVKPSGKQICLRHDVDDKPRNSLALARIQATKNVYGTYYFRAVSQSFDTKIIREISELGHEIGYHYENMDTCKGDVDKSYDDFCRNLEVFRKLADISTICMHGSPLSRYDNREIWNKYDYRKLGIIAEPYFDLDFSTYFYLTDTGRRWDGGAMNVRDKPMTKQSYNGDFGSEKLRFHETSDILSCLRETRFPTQAMITFHPQRWTNNLYDWYVELFAQSVKNQVKRLIVR